MTKMMSKSELTEAEQQYPLPPSVLAAHVYSDPARYRAEIESVFHRAWFPVLPAADIAAPADYVVWDRLHQSVVIARQPDGSVSAWHNVCMHRGARIVAESGSCPTGTLKCPWHGFVYNLRGEVVGVPLRESFDETELDGLRTPAVRAREWAGWIWLTLSDDTPPLETYLGVIGDELTGFGLERFTTMFRTSVTLQANWKLVVDAFNETWHVPFTHKDTLSGLVLWRDAALKITPPHSWMTIPIRGFTEKAQSEDHRQSHLCHYLSFPNTIFSCFPTHLQMWSVWPVSPTETVLCAYQIVGPPPEGLTDQRWVERNERDWAQFLEVLAEDVAVIDNFAEIGRGLGYTRNLFNTAESRLTAFHREVESRLAGPTH